MSMDNLPTVSGYFSPQERLNKRLHSLDSDSGPSKRTKIWDESGSLSSNASPSKTSRYFSVRTPEEDENRKRRLEARKKSLLADNNPFLKRAGSVQFNQEPSSVVVDDSDSDSGEEQSDADLSSLIAFFASEQQKSKRTVGKKKAKSKENELYTAGELQAIQLKKQHPGVLLMFEIGYKCLFFGDDAEIASRELGIKCSTERKLASAMVPMQRRQVYLKNLLSRGYKVGLVEQMETRALKKAAANKKTPFKRAVSQIYTAATYVDELCSEDNGIAPTLMCVVEKKRGVGGTSEKVTIGVVIVCPTSGEVTWDHFEDTRIRTELETRIVHTRPHELLLPESGLSRETSMLLNYFIDHTNTENKIRVENFDDTVSYSEAFSYLSKFYSESNTAMRKPNIMAIITDFPKLVIVALSHIIRYLSTFDVSKAFRQAIHFTEFRNKVHMLLNANTLTNLDIYRNESDFTKMGSLLWILDRTRTRFGSRRLRSWLGKPLTNINVVQDRLDAVEEMRARHGNEVTKKLGNLLIGLPDLEKGLCRIQYGTCTPKELCDILDAFHRVSNTFVEYATPEEVGCDSKLLREIIFALPRSQKNISAIMNHIKMGAAKIGEKHRMWQPTSKYYEEVEDCGQTVQFIEWELQEELKKIREHVGDLTLEFVDVGFEQYLVQLSNTKIEDGSISIPETWILCSGTKRFRRYRTGEVTRLMDERAQQQERLEAAANTAYRSFLEDITTQNYGLMRDAVNKLAVADCLGSLALVAGDLNYVRPRFTDDDVIDIKKGRHPMVEALRTDPFIPNDICIGGREGDRCKIITGPNMGGKSSATRMVAIIAVMAQIGSFVPADSVTIGMLDGIMTRMGASDELARGRSTFMVEMTETSDILHGSTSKSLVILDELGRGTSTFDGMAIAKAVVQHLIQNVNCKTLFVTHYPIIATDLEKRFPKKVQNLHMGYTEETRIDGSRDITFLYRLTQGVTTESFGVECGRLAGLPESILETAANKSQALKLKVGSRARKNKMLNCAKLLQECILRGDKAVLQELETIIDSLSIS